ncbi:hypothetical protein A7X87_13325 [Stenotrophomonas maltophilia]|nr:hypothetical protein A7X87_13325 [Stenotrophomonas maltophilia]
MRHFYQIRVPPLDDVDVARLMARLRIFMKLRTNLTIPKEGRKIALIHLSKCKSVRHSLPLSSFN